MSMTTSADTIIHVRAAEAWHGLNADEVRERVQVALDDRWPRPNVDAGVPFEERPPRPYLRDLYEDFAIIELAAEHWRYGYTVDPDTQDVALAPTGTQVAQEWAAVTQAGEAIGAVRRDMQTVRVHEVWPVGSIEATDVKNEWRVEFIAHGPTNDHQRYYTQEALEAAAPLYEGTRQYWNHETEVDRQRGYRDARDLASVLKNVRVSERGLEGIAHIFDADLNARMQDPEFRKVIGLSSDAQISHYPKTINGRETNVVTSILKAYSVDWVPEGNAGGRVIEAAQIDEEREDMKIEELNLDTLASERPDIVEAIEARAREAAQQEAADAQAATETAPQLAEAAPGEQQMEAAMSTDLDPRVQEAITTAVTPLQTENAKLREELTAVRQERAAEQCINVIRNMVAQETGITEASRKRIVRQFEGLVVPAAEISAKVAEAVADAQEYEMEALQECAPGTQVSHVGESASAVDAQANYAENLRAQLRDEGKTEQQVEAYMNAR